MKVIKCDCCKHEVKKHSNVVPPKDYWIKLVSTYIGKGNVDTSNMNLDLCNSCYLVVSAFIELFAKNKGSVARMFIHQDRPIVDVLQEYVRKNLLKENFYPSV